MRYVFSLVDYLPVLQDYTKGLVRELSDELVRRLEQDAVRLLNTQTLTTYFDQCLPPMLLSALIALVVYDDLAPSGKHMVNSYILLNDLWLAQLESEVVESELYIGENIGIDVRCFDDLCDVSAILANGILDFIEQIGLMEYGNYIAICQQASRRLQRVYSYGVEDITIAEIVLSARAVILIGHEPKRVAVY